jgi:hypothetical protein
MKFYLLSNKISVYRVVTPASEHIARWVWWVVSPRSMKRSSARTASLFPTNTKLPTNNDITYALSSVTCRPLNTKTHHRHGEQHSAQHARAARYSSAHTKQKCHHPKTHTRTARVDQLRNSLFNRFEKLLEQAQVSDGNEHQVRLKSL